MKTTKICLAALSFVLAGGVAAHAQELRNHPVTAIAIQGLHSVSEQLVRSHLEVQVGQPYNPNAVARDIRRLYGLGHFDAVKVDAAPDGDGVKLTYIVEEKRIIDSIRIIGDKKLKASKIRGVLSWKEGDSFTADAYDEERKAILKLYQEKGFANTSVDINVEEVGPSRVRVVYNITEGKRARIRSITFAGNDVLNNKKLRKTMKTKRGFWFIGGKYNEQKFEDDLKKIVDAYGNVGHLEAAVTGTDITYSDNGKKMNINIGLSEGAQYHVATLDTAHNEVFDDDEILGITKVHAGDVHNKGQVAKDGETIDKGYRDSGYVNAEVTPKVTMDRENKTTHLVYDVKEGDLKYVKEVEITGNSVTQDEVIRRDVTVAPGDRFDGSAIKFSQQSLENTRYFDKVRLTVHDIDNDDLYSNLLVDVDEGKTGNFNFGAGYSTEEKVGGFVELRLNNFDIGNWPKFSGGGQIFSTRLQIGSVRTQYSASFTEPELFGYPVLGGADVFDESYKYTKNAHYTEETAGGQIRFAKSLSQYVTLHTMFRYSDVSYSGIQEKWRYSSDWQRELSASTTVSNSWSIDRNTLDNYRDPTRGSKHELALTLAGLGGDNHFVKLEEDSSWYFPMTEAGKWILSFRTREGWMTPYGSSDFVPMAERFFAGGTSTVRGYNPRAIGPKEQRYWLFSKEKDPVGGDVRLVNNLEVKYKATDMLRLYAFMDSGGVWAASGSGAHGGELKYSAGIGLGVDIPKMGPVRVDYGIPINPDKDQGSGKLHMSTGFRF